MASTAFVGNSNFSADFASVIARSVAIASLPLTQLQQQGLKLNDRATALASLDGKAATLKGSLAAISESFGATALAVTSSDAAVLKPTVNAGASPASFSISIQNLGAATTFVASGYALVSDPKAGIYTAAASQTLTVDGVDTVLNPASTTLQGLVDEINSKPATNVRATIVNVGSTSTPNYQLSLQSTKLGAVNISLTDGAVINANTVAQRGASVEYTVNGAQVFSDSRTVTLAPNVTADLLKVTTTTTSVTLTESANSLKTALISFIGAFNAVVTEVDTHRGNLNSALSGDSILGTVTTTLRSLFNTAGGTSSFQALSDLGIGFDRGGKLTLDSTAFDKASVGKQADLKAFIGNSESGWFKSATSIVNGLEDDNNGIIKSSIAGNAEAIASQNSQIARQQDRIDRLENDLKARMAIADAAVAMLEQQAAYFTGLIQATRVAAESYN
ncbi:MAG: flagellar filament capping protein FliD [Bryobacteraceae bacterium]|nr:flagellar filament capping protein FliD [Bryobacteraceae bacterium]